MIEDPRYTIYATRSVVRDFIQFIREQGVVAFAIGFILGGGVNKVVTSLVNDVINPAIGYAFGNLQDLANYKWGTIAIGSFISNLINFLILAGVVYFIFKKLHFEKLDIKKDGLH